MFYLRTTGLNKSFYSKLLFRRSFQLTYDWTFFVFIFETGNWCIGLLLSALAFLDEKRWEQVTTRATDDLLQKGPISSQAMAKIIVDFANGSNEPQLIAVFAITGASREKSTAQHSQEKEKVQRKEQITGKSPRYEKLPRKEQAHPAEQRVQSRQYEESFGIKDVAVNKGGVLLKLVSTREKKDELPNNGNLSKENKHLNALADCKSALYEGLWVSSCSKSVEEYLLHTDINVEKKTQSEQRHKIMKCLSASPSKMMTVEELIDAIGIVTYDKSFIFRKHLKRSFLTGKKRFTHLYKRSTQRNISFTKERINSGYFETRDSEESTFEKAVKWQKEIAQRYSRYTLEPNFPEMKDTFPLLFRDEKSKILGKTLLKNAGFSDSELRKHLNFSKSTIARANHKVANAKSVLPDMWKTAFRMVRSRYPGRSGKNLLPKAKLVMKKLGAGDLLSRERTQLARRPRIDIDAQILETIVEISATSSDSGLLTHTKRHYDVKYLASVKESVERNQKLSAGRLGEQYNLIARETEMPTASVSTLKRRCLAPHSGHKNSQHYSNEAKIKFGKVPDTGTSIPSINLQYCRAFAKMEQRKPFRFDERFPHLREYTTINSTDTKAPVVLGSKKLL